MVINTYRYNIQRYKKWIKDYSILNKEINENNFISQLKSDYYRIQIRELKRVYSKDYQSKKLNLLELIVCSKELIPQKKVL